MTQDNSPAPPPPVEHLSTRAGYDRWATIYDADENPLVAVEEPLMDGLFREMRRVCRPGGRVVVSVMHPAMMLRGVQARFTDPTTGRETRPASCPHQVSDYVMAAIHAGCRFEHLSEHAVDEDLAARSERARKHLGWPILLLMRLTPDG